MTGNDSEDKVMTLMDVIHIVLLTISIFSIIIAIIINDIEYKKNYQIGIAGTVFTIIDGVALIAFGFQW